MARPRSLDDFKRREICAIVASGCSIVAAARYVSCSASTVRREAISNPEFGESLRRAELAAQLQPLKSLRDAAGTHWRAAAWLLERTNPRQFARHKPEACRPQELHDVVDAVIQEALDELPECEVRDRILRRLWAAAYRVSRSLESVEHARLNAGRGPFDAPSCKGDRDLQKVLDELENQHKRAKRSFVRFSQNTPRIA